jgi:hypothetical protein
MARLRGRAYLELGEHRDPIGGEPPPRSADGVRETNSRGRYSGRRTASARRSLSARARPDATRRLPRARQSTKTRGLQRLQSELRRINEYSVYNFVNISLKSRT